MKKKNIVFRTYQSKVSKQISQLPSTVRPLSLHCSFPRIRQIIINNLFTQTQTKFSLLLTFSRFFSSFLYSDDELRFMYENGQGHLTFFCIVFCLTMGTLQKKWFMYQNRLGPSDGIYYPSFVPCFVYHQLNVK